MDCFKAEPTRKKLVVYGDHDTGKTSLLIKFVTRMFPTEYVPPTIESVVVDMEVDGRRIELLLGEAEGYSTLYKLARVALQEVDVVLMCFSLTSASSFDSMPTLVHRVKQYGLHNAPIVMVGTKNDEQLNRVITFEKGLEMAKSVNAFRYVECSAKTEEGVSEVFETAVRSVIAKRGRLSASFFKNRDSRGTDGPAGGKEKRKRWSHIF
uniref:Rho-related GTP-binding protein RhoC n=1 Tax=Lygus hesperus TaxID=30085 RepID=A0A0A9WM14_LYGHE